MLIARSNTKSPSSPSAFTLLEIMLAVAVLSMVTFSIYRFVDTTVEGVRISSEIEKERGLDDAFERFFRAQMAALPIRISAINGEPHLFGGVAMDEIRWFGMPGFGAMTLHAKGAQTVILTAQENKENKELGPLEIGLRRQDANGRNPIVWTPLIQGVKGLEIRYFVEGSQEWVDKWTEPMTRPSLVRLRYWRGALPDPVEIIVRVPTVASDVLSLQLLGGGNSTPSTLSDPSRGQPPGGGAGEGNPENRRPGERPDGRRGGSPSGENRPRGNSSNFQRPNSPPSGIQSPGGGQRRSFQAPR